MRYVIIGGSIAGIAAARSIRQRSAEADITVISEEKSGAYYRPLIPFLIENENAEVMFEENPYEENAVQVLCGRAAGLDAGDRKVVLSSGSDVPFDRLLIATGSSPFIPEMEGIRGKGAFTLRTLDDATSIRKFAGGKKNAVVLGGGIAGIKAAVSLLHTGLGVTVVEQAIRILPGRLDSRGSQIIGDALKTSGIEIVTGNTVTAIRRRKGKIEAVRLSTGRDIPADLVVIAAGTRPNTGFLKDSGIRMQKGILVDEHLMTNIPGIYAAGDVVEYRDVSTGKSAVSGLWVLAEEMGKLAGENMAGGESSYTGFLSVMNTSSVLGIPFISLGMIDPPGRGYETFVDDCIGYYRKFVFRDNLLVGAVFIGELQNAGIFTSLIRNRIPAGNLKKEIIEGDLEFVHFLKTEPPPSLNV